MRALTGDELLGLPVRLHGVDLGRPVDLLLDRQALRVVGLDVLCGDEVHRFLPLPTAAVSTDGITIDSPLVLLEEEGLDFYRSRTLTLSSVRGRTVERKGRALGTLRDVLVEKHGGLAAVLVEVEGRTERVPFDDTLHLAPASRSAA
jgi:uncharacterized protein YrrD